MSDEQSMNQTPVDPTPATGVAEESTGATPTDSAPGAGDAWREVVSELDALGDALGRWLKAAVNDPDNKRRLDELSSRLEGFVSDVGSTVKGATDGEVGQSFKEAADKTGDAFKVAGEKISSEVGPKLAGAFKTFGNKLRDAADKIEERQATADAEPPAPQVDVTPEPPAPQAPAAPVTEPPAPTVPVPPAPSSD